jgi:uncharacterized protein (DUF1778 family)
MTIPQRKTEKLDIRLTPQAKRKLTAAAELTQRSISDFLLTSALAKADEALADNRDFKLDAQDWAKFISALDAPPKLLPRMRRLLSEPGVFDAK